MKNISKAIIVTIIVILSSCGKTTIEHKLVGTWNMQFFEKDPPYSKITWTFSADRKVTKDINGTKQYIGTYDVISKITDKGNYLVISGLSAEYGDSALANDDGKYFIHKLTSDQLVIERVEAYGRTEGVYKWYEFVIEK
jgi:gluconate kinase